jgi:hypothetical protein
VTARSEQIVGPIPQVRHTSSLFDVFTCMNCPSLPVTGGTHVIALAIASALLGIGIVLTYRTRRLTPLLVAALILGIVGLTVGPDAATAAPGCVATTTTVSGASGGVTPTTVTTTTTPAPATTLAPTTTIALTAAISGRAQSSGYSATHPSGLAGGLPLSAATPPEVLDLAGLGVHLIGAGPDAVFGTADDLVQNTTTSATGTYSFSALPAGAFTVTVDDIASLAGDVLSSICEWDELSSWTWAPALRSTSVSVAIGGAAVADFTASNAIVRHFQIPPCA